MWLSRSGVMSQVVYLLTRRTRQLSILINARGQLRQYERRINLGACVVCGAHLSHLIHNDLPITTIVGTWASLIFADEHFVCLG